MAADKHGFEEALSNMIAASAPFFKDYAYYAYIIAQCKLVFDPKLQAPAAIRFVNTQYELIINPEPYGAMPLKVRIGILKHECMHILDNHVFRAENGNYDNLGFNYAADCAINQDINIDHLPAITAKDLEGQPNPKGYKVGDTNAIVPANFPSKTSPVPNGLTAEHYYDMLDRDELPKEGEPGEGNGCGGLGGTLDDHSTWAESEGVEGIKDAVTKQMLDNAFSQTSKARGNIPSKHSEWLEIFSNSSEVNWKTLLRRIVGNKRANRKSTLMRKNRRLPNANHIKGHTKQRVFDLLIVSDVSGSVSSKELTETWSESLYICKMTNTPVTLIQVDTAAHEPESLKATTKSIQRKAQGGTVLAPAINKAKEHRVAFDAVVVTTDGYISESDVQAYASLGVPIIWLITSEGNIMDSMTAGRMVAVKLKGK